MPRGKNTKTATVNLTDAQYKSLSNLAAEEGIAAYLRRLVAEDAERRGSTFPDDLPGHGGNRRLREMMAVADRVTDYGRNDPAE